MGTPLESKWTPRQDRKHQIQWQRSAWQLDLPYYQKLVLIALMDFSDGDGRFYPSTNTIAKMTGYSQSRVKAIMQKLRDNGVIRPLSTTNLGTTFYQANLEAVSRSDFFLGHEERKYERYNDRRSGKSGRAADVVGKPQQDLHSRYDSDQIVDTDGDSPVDLAGQDDGGPSTSPPRGPSTSPPLLTVRGGIADSTGGISQVVPKQPVLTNKQTRTVRPAADTGRSVDFSPFDLRQADVLLQGLARIERLEGELRQRFNRCQERHELDGCWTESDEYRKVLHIFASEFYKLRTTFGEDPERISEAVSFIVSEEQIENRDNGHLRFAIRRPLDLIGRPAAHPHKTHLDSILYGKSHTRTGHKTPEPGHYLSTEFV